MMDENLIVEKFREIKELGFVKSKRPYSTGIGKTFEDYLGVTENNEIGPDFAGFEVVSKRTQTSTFLSLFTKSPSHPRSVNTILLERYGEEYEGYPGMRKLHTSVFAGKFNTYRNAYGFRIVNDTQGKKIVLEVSSLPEMEVIDSSVYWTYHDLEQCLLTKLKALFFVYADSDMRDGTEYFHYTQADIYLDPSLENLLKLIDRGRLMIDIRIGSYKTGKMKGKPHDHGTGFRIRPEDLSLLYEHHLHIDWRCRRAFRPEIRVCPPSFGLCGRFGPVTRKVYLQRRFPFAIFTDVFGYERMPDTGGDAMRLFFVRLGYKSNSLNI